LFCGVKQFGLLKKDFAAWRQAVSLPPHPFTCRSLKLIGKFLLPSHKVDIIFTVDSSGRFRPFLNALALRLDSLTVWTAHGPKSKAKFVTQLFLTFFSSRRQTTSEGSTNRFVLYTSGLKAQRCRTA
jgi:hypothetical protein